MKLKLVFSGGSEALFADKREHEVTVPDSVNVEKLLQWVLENLIVDKRRSELLIVKGNVRPGILVLVNDTDYEITGGVGSIVDRVFMLLLFQLDTKLSDGDEVTFISTLHGG